MRRREFVMILGTATVGWPLAARTQPMKVPRVGWIWAGRSARNPTEVAGFHQGLKDLGYIEGQNIVVDYRFAEDRRDRIPDLVAELLELRPDVVVAVGDLIVSAVRECHRDNSYRWAGRRPGWDGPGRRLGAARR